MEAKSKIFVDSNFFIALFNLEDGLYHKASFLSERLGQEQRQLVLSNFIFAEIVTILSMRRGVDAAHKAGEYILQNPAIEILYIDYELQRQAWEIFKELKMKNLSFVDASTIAVMQAESLLELLTFDVKDFKPLTRKYNIHLYAT